MGLVTRILSPLAFISLIVAVPCVHAQEAPLASCRSEVSYKWSRVQRDPGKEPGKDSGKELEKDERVVFFAMVEQRAPSIEEAKGSLAEEVARVKTRAHDRCKDLHQNLSGCISSRYAAHSATLASLGFSARRSLEDAIMADCNSEQGTCGAVSASEPECREPPKAAEEAAAGEEKKPEGGGKKKK